jgi:hypothetical protein
MGIVSNRIAVFAMTSVIMLIMARICWAGGSTGTMADLLSGRFQWTVSEPLVVPAERLDDPCYSIKDPSVVFYQGRWHLFCTIRSQKRSHQIEYLSFTDWKDANVAQRHILKMHDGYFCAPQVFYFTPHGKMIDFLSLALRKEMASILTLMDW